MGEYPDAMFVIDMQERVIDYNPACLELLGLPKEEWSGRSLEDLCAKTPDLLAAVRYGNESGQYVLSQDGESKRLLRVTIALLKQPNGDPAGKLVVMRKVTTGSLGLRQEEGTARIRANLLFQMVPSALLTVNQRGIITYLNPVALEVMGYTLEEVLGRSCHDFMDQDCAGRCWVNHPELAEPVRGLRCGLRTKNGETRIILKNVELLRSSTGTVIGAIESFEDITEREQIERRLRVSETRYRSLYSNMQSGFGLYELVVDEDDRPVDFRLLEINPAYEHMLGESIHNPVGKYISQLFPTSSVDFIRRYGPVAAGGGPLRLEEYLPEVQRSFNVLAYAPEINQLAVLLEDVTDLQKAEAGRHAALQMIDTLREISRGVIYRLETEAVAEWILARLNDILPFDTAFILLVEPHSLIVQHQFWQGVKHDQRRINKNRLDETWLFTRMAGSVRTLVVSDVMREPEWQGEPGQEDVRSFAGVPVLIRDELAGFICCESLTTGFYRMEAVQKPLLTVAALAALALDNARHSGEKQYQVTHDPLTGLNNHVIFQSLFEHALELARRQQRKLALIYLDLIGFKAVNEVFGRDHGDKVLRSVAERLQASLRQCDILARPGEDEFLVLLENIAREEDASTVARKLGKVLAEPHIIQGQEVVVPASSGLAVFPRDGNSSDELFEAARISLDSARKQLSG